MRSKGYGSHCVCVSVYLSVKSHLTLEASLRPENTVTYSAGDEGQNNICGIFSETAPLPKLSALSHEWPYIRSAINFLRIICMSIVHMQVPQGLLCDARAPCCKLYLHSI